MYIYIFKVNTFLRALILHVCIPWAHLIFLKCVSVIFFLLSICMWYCTLKFPWRYPADQATISLLLLLGSYWMWRLIWTFGSVISPSGTWKGSAVFRQSVGRQWQRIPKISWRSTAIRDSYPIPETLAVKQTNISHKIVYFKPEAERSKLVLWFDVADRQLF